MWNVINILKVIFLIIESWFNASRANEGVRVFTVKGEQIHFESGQSNLNGVASYIESGRA